MCERAVKTSLIAYDILSFLKMLYGVIFVATSLLMNIIVYWLIFTDDNFALGVSSPT